MGFHQRSFATLKGLVTRPLRGSVRFVWLGQELLVLKVCGGSGAWV